MSFLPAAVAATQSLLRLAVQGASGDIAKALENFERETGICGKYNGQLAILDYDSLRVDWKLPYGWVCRGLILDPLDNWKVIAFGLPKFFNYGESNAAPIDWSTALAYEKLDGSMVQRYFNPYTGRFEYSTRFQLHGDLARNKVNGLSAMTWLGIIEMSIGDYAAAQPTDETWVFEVQTPLNKIVVQHRTFKANLIAIRNVDTLLERPVFGLTRAPKTREPLGGAKGLKDEADNTPGTESEGFVVCDANFNRVKIKSASYVALHRLKDGINSVGAVIDLAKGGDYEEVTVNFPEYELAIVMAKAAIETLVHEHERAYTALRDIETQKDFALAVQKWNLQVPGALYLTRAGKKASIREAIFDMRDNAFHEVVRKRLGQDFLDACLLPPTQLKPTMGVTSSAPTAS